MHVEQYSSYCSAYGGYVVGLGTTIVVMNVFEAAQPALLYIVPAVLAAVLGHAAINKQFRQVIYLRRDLTCLLVHIADIVSFSCMCRSITCPGRMLGC